MTESHPEPEPRRPAPGEHADYYAGYLEAVPDGPILERLADQLDDTLGRLEGLSDDGALFRYAPGKWSIKEVVGHLVDTERVFSFRALWFARRAPEPQPGMEQDDWAAAGQFDRRPLAELLDELRATRAASLHLFRGFAPDVWRRRGTASGYEFTVRSLPWIIAGHELHHRRVLDEKYLG